MVTIDESLNSWSDIKGQFCSAGSGILLGNGFSCAVWDKFNYPSLYQKACAEDMNHPLSLKDRALFKSMDTKNFEQVLSALATTKIVNSMLELDYSIIEERYKSIQLALSEAVEKVHIPWKLLENKDVLPNIRKELLNYEFVYTTNYDLLTYWAVNLDKNNMHEFKDYFFNSSNIFDITNTNVSTEPTKVLYLHGGLHLYAKLSGGTIKRKNQDRKNILELFDSQLNENQETVPLIVAEGKGEDKLDSIKSSDYLSFAYGQLAKHQGSLVIFGHGLGESDKHILNAIYNPENYNRIDRIAVSIRGKNSPEDIRCRKAELQKKLPKWKEELIFFDAQTHPLGSPDLKVEEN